jgi:ribosomal protein L10
MTKHKIQERLLKNTPCKLSLYDFMVGMTSVLSVDDFNIIVAKVLYKLGKEKYIISTATIKQILEPKVKK